MKEDNKYKKHPKTNLRKKRFQLLRRLDRILEIPMIILAVVWIVLLVLELLRESNPLLEKISFAIWIIFIVDFSIKFIIAPNKSRFISANIIIIISLIVPAFRTFNILRLPWLLKFTRTFIFFRLIGGMGRGMRALAHTMKKRAFGYISVLTLIILVIGSIGMYIFERDVNPGLNDFGSSIWWTAMLFTTIGSASWPVTAEGRILCVLLSIYTITIFGYLTATFATFFIDEDAHSNIPDIPSSLLIENLHKENKELRERIERQDGMK